MRSYSYPRIRQLASSDAGIALALLWGVIHTAGSWLAGDGPLAILRQPMSGIPYKVFVYLSGAGRLSFPMFLWGNMHSEGSQDLLGCGNSRRSGALGR